jgi:hypothetical protein
MNEQELRSALRQAMPVQPPPMSDELVLAAARRDVRRRRAVWASVGSAAAVVLVAAGVVVLAPAGAGDDGVRVGDQPSSTAPSPVPGWDDERAAALAAALDDLAPAGYETPADLPGAEKHHQGSGTEGMWNYDAITPLTKGAGVGSLSVSVSAPGHRSTGEGCSLSPTPWHAGTGDCTEITVHGKKVAVVDKLSTQWAGFRYPDGTRVFVMQSATFDNSVPALDGMPMTREQLAALVVDASLKVQ